MKYKLVFCLALIILIISCEKNNADSPKANIEQLLTGKTWLVEKLTFTESNRLYKYKRNAQNNDVNYYTNDRIIFTEDGKGIYRNFGTNEFEISWEFTDSKKSIIEYIIYDYSAAGSTPGENLMVTMENVVVDENFLNYAEIYTKKDNKSIVSSVSRIAIP